ncbi:Rep family ATP-dependent DNA helicase [Scopulibacillus darangshiensis]|uniref:Rep family ATP-dependent DNA helicase n=1 Tax=Scopulibacillus darangshiensis TaxID=442528 RepID=A0A4R2NJE2_9BACL|nr:UvrD-helicase domain-containing protein [Scopulibacillus darangshiensis]TCP21345.1 Rep family ATP-dependent DNA helicase [Scopulibacillus darangshiensis]
MEKFQSAYRCEQQQLSQIAAEIENQLAKLENMPRYAGEDLTEQALEDVRERARKSLRIAKEEPYFGRLDFEEDGQGKPKPLYIGKAGVAGEESVDPLIIDWRAPVASMFYSFTGGEEPAFYNSPEGLIEGDIHLKRNIAIRTQVLQRVVDTYVRGGDDPSVSDEFLLYRLGENKDHRLRDIVSTIQSEQNDIIRSQKNTPLIIQGVAGSGKTTVALHRLAYLIYEYREHILAEKMIIFAPNAMFLDYISNVLPELGVGGIQQTTFNDWALDLLDHEIKLKDPSEKLFEWFEIREAKRIVTDDGPEKFKGSSAFMRMIDECFNKYENSAVPTKAFVAWDGTALAADTIQRWYAEQERYPLAKRRERITNRIKNWIDSEVKKVPERHLQKELKKKASQRLRSYLKSWPKHTPLSFYQSLFNEKKRPEYVPQYIAENIPKSIVKTTFQNCKKKELEQEDLAPLVLIHQRLNGIERKDKFHHVVIDEAQDFSPFQIEVLKARTTGNSFTILGDLSQGIHDYQGIREWKEIQDIFAGAAGYFELEKSYRSTMEIIHFANKIISAGTKPVSLADPVFRSGEEVKTIEVPPDERVHSIIQTVSKLQTDDVNSIAIALRTEAECFKLHSELQEAGLTAHLIHSGQREYGGGLSIMPVYLTKGLEFDAVLLIDVDADHYEQTERDAKLLYVGCTRALHDLWLFYSSEPSPLLRDVNKGHEII